MGLKFFIISIFIISIFFYFAPVNSYKQDIEKEDKAQFIFDDPIMYSLNELGLSKKIIASQTVRYATRDEMYVGDITLYNQDITKDFIKENLKADFITKKEDIYTLEDNIVYKRDDFITIYTDFLIYDSLNQIAKNSHPFKSEYYTHKYDGENLYYEIEKASIKSTNTHFEIEMNKK